MINIQNTDDNECFKWCLVRYLNPADHHPVRITKTDGDFSKRLDFKDKISSQYQRHSQNRKKGIPSLLVSLATKIKKNIQSMYQKFFVKINMLISY